MFIIAARLLQYISYSTNMLLSPYISLTRIDVRCHTRAIEIMNTAMAHSD